MVGVVEALSLFPIVTWTSCEDSEGGAVVTFKFEDRNWIKLKKFLFDFLAFQLQERIADHIHVSMNMRFYRYYVPPGIRKVEPTPIGTLVIPFSDNEDRKQTIDKVAKVLRELYDEYSQDLSLKLRS